MSDPKLELSVLSEEGAQSARPYLALKYLPIVYNLPTPLSEEQKVFTDFAAALLLLSIYIHKYYPKTLSSGKLDSTSIIMLEDKAIPVYLLTREWILTEFLKSLCSLGLDKTLTTLLEGLLLSHLQGHGPKQFISDVAIDQVQLKRLLLFIKESIIFRHKDDLRDAIQMDELAYICITNFVTFIEVISGILEM